MDLTSLDLPEKRVLRALFELAQLDHPANSEVLAWALDLDMDEVGRVLARLAARKLAEERVRLTLSGLAVAANVPPLGLAERVPFAGNSRAPGCVARGASGILALVGEREEHC